MQTTAEIAQTDDGLRAFIYSDGELVDTQSFTSAAEARTWADALSIEVTVPEIIEITVPATNSQIEAKPKTAAPAASQLGNFLKGLGVCSFGFVLLCWMIGHNASNQQGSKGSGEYPVSTAPRTALGNRSHSRNKHLEDAKEYLMKDARASVRKGYMTRREFEKYTGVEY